MPIQPATSLDKTILFGRLNELEAHGSCPLGLGGNVLAICGDAAQRLKIFPAIHGQFTLHDETHCLRVVQLMAQVAGDIVQRLNALEIALLILSAYFHDQGMVVDSAELTQLQLSDDWKIHEEDWSCDHPNYGEALARLSDPLLVPAERDHTLAVIDDLRSAMFTAFVRRHHGERSGTFLQSRYKNDARLVWNSMCVVDLLALISVSHVRPAETITAENTYRFDELVGTTRVNVALLAYILRLADILDFDRERTPESLYRAIHFTSLISLLEWEKHRRVTGWEITSDRIVFAAECTHPAYERAIREYFDWIDSELSAAHAWNRSLPAAFQAYRLNLPQKVDRSRVGARVDPVTHQAAYQFYDLEFTLSRDEIVKLLMTDRLYSNKSLFVRELLQNALDALRHRAALYHAAAMTPPDLQVHFEHCQESGFDIVRCCDSGVGMDEHVILGYVTRVGRSYYRSPEFERERAGFREKGCDFDPCARFGIGFMSCFMFGDDITIYTRRDYGLGQAHGQPLIVEIKGLSGIVVIRRGAAGQPVGTTVENFSQRGLMYREALAIDPEAQTLSFLERHTWYDEVGRAIETLAPNGPATKTTYDGLGRATKIYVTDRADDADPGTSGNYGDVYDASTHEADTDGDSVFEQMEYAYIPDTDAAHVGQLEQVTTRHRTHDATDQDTGPLDELAQTDEELVITTYAATFYDGADRAILSVDYGTNDANDRFVYTGTSGSQGTPDICKRPTNPIFARRL